MSRKNVLFLLIDGLRYDVLADADAAAKLTPNLARLVKGGQVLRCTANAQATQFVMPALFSGTYPLDYGGYNDGILRRPASYVEVLRDAGYRTLLAASCNMLTPSSGYDRGFAEMHTASDYRHLLEYRIEKTLSYHLRRWRAGEMTTAETATAVMPDLDRVLEGIETDMRGHGKTLWPPRLRRINARVASRIPDERRLLKEDPFAILNKLQKLPPILYWRWLGRRDVNPLHRFWHRAVESVRWRSRRFAAKYNVPLLISTHYQVISGEVFGGVIQLIRDLQSPWYLHMHVMDLHDCFVHSRPLHALCKFRFLPRYLKARWAGATSRNPLYDLTLCYVDAHVGRLLDQLERMGRLADLNILVTGDHGNRYAESPRPKRGVAVRTNYEDIEVPFVLWGADGVANPAGLMDTMGMTATLLDLCEVEGHPSFKGVSAFSGGREVVISESAGSGNADVRRRDLYFTVTTKRHRMMTVLRGSELEVLQLFDREADPRELVDLSKDSGHGPIVEELLHHIHVERAELLAMRGATPPFRATADARAAAQS